VVGKNLGAEQSAPFNFLTVRLPISQTLQSGMTTGCWSGAAATEANEQNHLTADDAEGADKQSALHSFMVSWPLNSLMFSCQRRNNSEALKR
jgi:hypothetical protein